MSESWVWWALLSAVFAAATGVLSKAGSADIDPDLATLIRTAVVLACMLLLVTATGKWSGAEALSRRTVIFLVLSGVATGASWLCYFHALKAGDVSKVGPVDKLSVVLVVLFAVLFLRERLNPREWAGVALIAAGVLMLAIKK